MKKTPFYNNLVASGGKMVEFAGYAMPIQFSGIIAEHKAVRENVGLFDVSHMAEFIIKGDSALASLEWLTSNVISTLAVGKARYTLMLNDKGGVVDDILVYRMGEQEFMLVANAANYQKDARHLQDNLLAGTELEDITEKTALLALQGKGAEGIMASLFGKEMLPSENYAFTSVDYKGGKVIISRTGYTGEDGYEIFAQDSLAQAIFADITSTGDIPFCGLGARDTLRLEAGMPLYGHEMDEDTLAHEIGLGWFIKMDAKDFKGKAALMQNPPQYKRIGLKIDGRGIARDGMKVLDKDGEVGYITSGTFSPTLGYPIAMARVNKDVDCAELDIEIRGSRVSATVVSLPFYKRQK